jgi:hypothetical protein
MKLRHMPATFAHSPLFLLRNAPKMFAHTFRGSTLRSFLGLEDERKAFQRFQAIRRAERVAGVPARIVGWSSGSVPPLEMDQSLPDYEI